MTLSRACLYADLSPERPAPRFRAGLLSTWLAVAAMILMAVGAGGWTYLASRRDFASERDPATHCLTHIAAPTATLVLVDGTDPLAQANGARFVAVMDRLRQATPRNGRLIVATFDGDLGHPLDVKFDWCSPGRADEADPVFEGPVQVDRAYTEGFRAPLDRAVAAMAVTATAPHSPVAEQIARAVGDASLPWRGHRRNLVVLTDGLENTETMSPYRGDRFALPPAIPSLLDGVNVSFIELPNARDSRLQTGRVRAAWARWLTDSGGQVKMFAPGYPPPD